MRPSPPRCWPRSSPRRSRWRWPPPRRSPPGASGRSAPPSWPSSGPATTLTGPSAPSWPVEPENRLVARTLEARWETRLAALAEAEAALAAQRSARPTLPSRDELAATSPRPARPVVRAHHQRQGPQAAAAHPDRRRHRAPRQPATARRSTVGLRWHPAPASRSRSPGRRGPASCAARSRRAIELARRLGPGLDNNALADALNAAGHRTGTGQPFDVVAASATCATTTTSPLPASSQTASSPRARSPS